MTKITYLLGAGASCLALPMVADLTCQGIISHFKITIFQKHFPPFY